MAAFELTANTLREKAQDLKSLNDRFRQAVENLEASQKRLAATWEGEAKEAFDSVFAADKGQFDLFAATVDDYYVKLQNIITGYEQAEAKNVGIAGSRTS